MIDVCYVLCHTDLTTVRVVLSAGTFAEEPIFTSTNLGGRFLDVRFERSLQLWPWSGFLALYIRVTQDGAGFEARLLTIRRLCCKCFCWLASHF